MCMCYVSSVFTTRECCSICKRHGVLTALAHIMARSGCLAGRSTPCAATGSCTRKMRLRAGDLCSGWRDLCQILGVRLAAMRNGRKVLATR